MNVTTKLFATLRDNRFQIRSGEYPPGTTVLDIIHALGIDEGEVALILVNGRHADHGQPLSNSDTIALFPPIGGG